MAKSIRLGLFVVLTLLAFGAGVFWIGSGSFRFSSTYRLNTYFDNVAGLPTGATVRVGGVHEGTVHAIVLPTRPDQKVQVQMDLTGVSRQVIKKDSIASIRTEGLVGDEFVEITFGSAGAPPVREGDTIGSEAPLQISDMMKKANALLDAAQGTIQNIGETANNLQGVSAKLNSGKGSMGALINNPALYQHINEATANLQEDTEALKHNFLLRGFFKNRGYEDAIDLKRYAVAELPAGEPLKSFSYRGSKLFDKPDGAKLKSGKQLDDAGHYLEQNSFGTAVVAGFTDMTGDSDKQRQLSLARAAVAREYLVQHFKLDDTRIKTIGEGKSSDAPDGGALEVLVYAAGRGGR
jgi:phospholipid/cholesterol/gamma-HCH transport system substrate-binding protein